MTIEPLRTVPAVLSRLDTAFSDFAAAFHEGQYALWLGSGISRDRVPDVSALLERVLEMLRSSIDTQDAQCAYRSALREVLGLAQLEDDELDGIDYALEVGEWPLRRRIVRALVSHYSKVLDVLVGDDKPQDYLVWSGLDVSNTYGSPDLEPDVEHYCIAILMLEGLVGHVVTANWDGLLEKALGNLTLAFDAVARVVITPDDFRQPGRRIEIIKFHGCAVRAREDEEVYRPLLIARESQIAAWTSQAQNRPMRKHLELLYTDRPSLMIGLSAQDANLQTVFATAIDDLARPWPATPPAIVLSEESLQTHHRNLLMLTYGSAHQGNATAIADSALLGSFGKPTLLGLVLASLTEKLASLLEHVLLSTWSTADVQGLRGNLLSLRNAAANRADTDRSAFIVRFMDVLNLTLTVFRTGHVPAVGGSRYEPLSELPIAQTIHSPDFPAHAFGWLSIAVAMVGRGRALGAWSVLPGDSTTPGDGVLRLVTEQRDARVFFVKDGATRTILELENSIDDRDGSVFIVVAAEEPPASARSSSPRFGRNGKVSAGHFSIATNIADTASADELYEAFKLAGGF